MSDHTKKAVLTPEQVDVNRRVLNNIAYDELARSHEALRLELARLTEDRERIEWLERRVQTSGGCVGLEKMDDGIDLSVWMEHLAEGKATVREAIDAAKEQE